VGDEVELAVSLPLDGDGFLRRECPTCQREFKWLSAGDEQAEAESTPVPEGGYWCPYCAIQAPPDAWWTPAQLEIVNSAISKEMIEPELESFERSVKSAAKRSGGFIEISVERDAMPEADPLVETDDMRHVEFACHPEEPIKVLDNWAGDVHCLICGTPTLGR
jgi:hypothetical protein